MLVSGAARKDPMICSIHKVPKLVTASYSPAGGCLLRNHGVDGVRLVECLRKLAGESSMGGAQGIFALCSAIPSRIL